MGFMGYREDNFKDKFRSAAKELGVSSKDVLSLKIPENISSYHVYHEMLDSLDREVGIQAQPLQGNYQGRAYLISHEGQQIIIVEHETGLELLYIAGSIASCVGLIPLILKAWQYVRDHMPAKRPKTFKNIEIRRIDNRGKLQEDRALGLIGPDDSSLSILNSVLAASARVVDAEVFKLRKEVQRLARRVAKLEKKAG